MTGIDPAIIVSIIGGILIALAGIVKGNSVATQAIEALQAIMDIADSYIKGDADKVWTTDEDAAFGKAVRIGLTKIHNSAIAVFFNSIKK